MSGAPADAERFDVVIVGAGIAGLCLAALLERVEPRVSYLVVERDTHLDAREGGYSLTIQHMGKQALRELDLLKKLYRIECRCAAYNSWNSLDGSCIHAGGGAKKKARRTGNVPLPRQLLRHWLHEKADPNRFQWGDTVDLDSLHYSDDVQLRLLNSNRVLSTRLLVACEGIRSPLRNRFAPSAPLTYLGFVTVNGIADSTSTKFKNKVTQWLDGTYRVFTKPYEHPRTYMWQLTFAVPPERLQRFLETAELAETDDDSSLPPFDDGTQWKTSPAYLELVHRKVCEITQDYVQELRDLVHSTPVRSMRVGPLCDRDPRLEWEASQVPMLFIGDSAHPMTPFKGHGANCGLWDALLIYNCIRSDGIPSRESLQALQKKMMENAERYVLQSREKTFHLHTPEALLHIVPPKSR